MAMIQDVAIPAKQWVNLHTLAGITAGNGIYWQNKIPGQITYFEGAAAPADGPGGNKSGRILGFTAERVAQAGTPGVWVYSTIAGFINVEEYAG